VKLSFNDALESSQSVNSDPGAGWMIKIKISNIEVDDLLSSEAYKELIGA
jgi:glycine cleavage system H lipoate-binding protein